MDPMQQLQLLFGGMMALGQQVAAAANQQNALQLQMVAPKAKAGLPALLDRAYSANNLQLALPASGVVAQDQLALPAPAQPVAAQPVPPQPGPAQPASAEMLLALEAGVADAKEAPAQVGAVTTAPVEPGATKEHVQEKKRVPLSESLRKLGNAAAKGKRTAEAGSSQPVKKNQQGSQVSNLIAVDPSR